MPNLPTHFFGTGLSYNSIIQGVDISCQCQLCLNFVSKKSHDVALFHLKHKEEYIPT